MKPKLSINTNAKPLLKRPSIEVQTTPKHKYSSSLITPKSLNSISGSTRAKPSFSSFLSPNISQNMIKAKHSHAISQQFPISPQSPRLIKIPKFETIEDKALWNSLSIPISPESVLKSFKGQLTAIEQVEILSFEEVFFIGIGANKIKNLNSHNSGFDDEEGDYRITNGDHLVYRFEIIQQLGSGSFGKVVKVHDHKTKQDLALKIIKNKPRFHEQAREEIEVLNYLKLRDTENSFSIIHLIESFNFRNHVVKFI